jgi:peptide deformylase
MILPIVAYGTPILRQKSRPVSPEYPNLTTLITDLWDTLESAGGVGLAAPQVGQQLRLFIIDNTREFSGLSPAARESHPEFPGIRQVFINPVVTAYSWATTTEPEGCLSIPGLEAHVPRPNSITLQYQQENFSYHQQTFIGRTARIIGHEYDHLEGKLYLDYLGVLQKRLLEGKLRRIRMGEVRANYPMRFP